MDEEAPVAESEPPAEPVAAEPPPPAAEPAAEPVEPPPKPEPVEPPPKEEPVEPSPPSTAEPVEGPSTTENVEPSSTEPTEFPKDPESLLTDDEDGPIKESEVQESGEEAIVADGEKPAEAAAETGEETEHKEGEAKVDGQVPPKTTAEEEEDIFVDKNLNIFGEPRGKLGPVISFSDDSFSIMEEEEEEEEFELYDLLGELGLKDQMIKKEPINREAYMDEYQTLQAGKKLLRRKNAFFNKKMSDYYRKRKLEQVFEDSYTDFHEHLYDKYDVEINEFYEMREKWDREKLAIDNELSDLGVTRDEHITHLAKLFNGLLAREKEIGALCLDPNTGKTLSEKVYERFLHRQRYKSQEIGEIRIIFIKHRDKVKEIENKIKALETIDGTLQLIDFEQLRMENTTYADKIEERDEELMRLRDRHSHAHQSLAHTREKLNVIVEEIEEKKDEYIRHEFNVCEIREYLNELKITRDSNRAQTEKLNLSSGLLIYPRLLIDMEQSLQVEARLTTELEELIAAHKESRNKLIAIRNSIEHVEHTLIKRNIQQNKHLHQGREFYKGRPTIFKPKFPSTSLDIKDILKK